MQYSKLVVQIMLKKQWKILPMWDRFRISTTVCLLWLIFTETLEMLKSIFLLEIWWRLVKESFTKVKLCDLFQGTLMNPNISSFLYLGVLSFCFISPTEHSLSLFPFLCPMPALLLWVAQSSSGCNPITQQQPYMHMLSTLPWLNQE